MSTFNRPSREYGQAALHNINQLLTHHGVNILKFMFDKHKQALASVTMLLLALLLLSTFRGHEQQSHPTNFILLSSFEYASGSVVASQ
jgi:hypothetical protein